MTNSLSNIFISYRRSDSQGTTGRIHDRLIPHFDNVYIDVDSIGLGEDFFDSIEEKVKSSNFLLVVIGRNWLEASNENGRRLDNPDDVVRFEISTALRNSIRVIPIIVNGASMPGSTDLPDDISFLVRRNAFMIRHESFHADSERLINAIRSIIDEEDARKQEEARKQVEARKQANAQRKAKARKQEEAKKQAEDNRRKAEVETKKNLETQIPKARTPITKFPSTARFKGSNPNIRPRKDRNINELSGISKPLGNTTLFVLITLLFIILYVLLPFSR